MDAHFNLGVLHHTFEKVELAIRAYERAVRLDPLHYDALSNLGSARHKFENYDGAIRAYEEAIKIVTKLPADVVDYQVESSRNRIPPWWNHPEIEYPFPDL